MDTDLLKTSEELREPTISSTIEPEHVEVVSSSISSKVTSPANVDESYLQETKEQLTSLSVQIAQQKFSDRVQKDIELQEERQNEVWKPIIEAKHHKELDSIYHTISPVELPFFDVLDQKLFTEQTKINFEELEKRYNIHTVQRWDGSEIDKMFGKGLNPTSLITSLESAQWFEKNLPQKDNPTILELGTGAGWGTVMLFNTLEKKNPDQKIKQFSVDMSAHSIAATETLLNYSGIPYITVADGAELIQIQKWLKENPEGENFSGVILVLDRFNDVMDKFGDASIDGIYSSHGTAYLSKNEYTDLLQKSTRVLGEEGLFIADSLNPLYTNKLDTFFTLSQIMNPDKVKKSLDKKGVDYIYSKEKLKNNSKYFLNQDVKVLKGFNTEEAYLILRWCNYLLKNMELERLTKTIESLSVTMKVVDDYRADVFPSFLLNDVVKENDLKFEKLDGRPDFPIFMDTQGFRLKK